MRISERPGTNWHGYCITTIGTMTQMETLILSATLIGSLGTAWAIQRAILGLCMKAISTRRP
jgi:hypothetical protein